MKKNSLLWGIGAAVLLSSVAFAQSPAASATAGQSANANAGDFNLPDPIKLQLAGIVSNMMQAQLRYREFGDAVLSAFGCQIKPTEQDPYHCTKPPVTPPAPPPVATPPPSKPAPPPASPPPVASPASPPSLPSVRK